MDIRDHLSQMDVVRILIKTSFIPTSGTGTSSSHKPRSALFFTKAFTATLVPMLFLIN